MILAACTGTKGAHFYAEDKIFYGSLSLTEPTDLDEGRLSDFDNVSTTANAETTRL